MYVCMYKLTLFKMGMADAKKHRDNTEHSPTCAQNPVHMKSDE